MKSKGGGARRRNCDITAVPVGLWPGSEEESGAGQQKGQGWPAVGGQGPHRGGLHTKKPSECTVAESVALLQRLFLPCLFPCTIGLINIFRAAGLLRPVSICMTVGSGRRPFPRLTALKKGQKIEMSTILAADPTAPSVKLASVQQYHGLSSNESSQHASSRNTRSAEGYPDICPPQQPAIIQSPCLLRHLGRGKLQHRKPPKTSVLTLSQLERRARQGGRQFSSWEMPKTNGLCNQEVDSWPT